MGWRQTKALGAGRGSGLCGRGTAGSGHRADGAASGPARPAHEPRHPACCLHAPGLRGIVCVHTQTETASPRVCRVRKTQARASSPTPHRPVVVGTPLARGLAAPSAQWDGEDEAGLSLLRGDCLTRGARAVLGGPVTPPHLSRSPTGWSHAAPHVTSQLLSAPRTRLSPGRVLCSVHPHPLALGVLRPLLSPAFCSHSSPESCPPRVQPRSCSQSSCTLSPRPWAAARGPTWPPFRSL